MYSDIDQKFRHSGFKYFTHLQNILKKSIL